MKHLLLLIFSICTIISNAQTIQTLETDNGFKDFKLGDTKQKYGNSIHLDNLPPVSYRYSGDCCKTAFGRKIILEISLYFKSDKLEAIEFLADGLYSKRSTAIEELVPTIEKAYGKSKHLGKYDLSGYPEYYLWKSSNVVLLVEFKYMSDKYNALFTYLTVDKFNRMYPELKPSSSDH